MIETLIIVLLFFGATWFGYGRGWKEAETFYTRQAEERKALNLHIATRKMVDAGVKAFNEYHVTSVRDINEQHREFVTKIYRAMRNAE